MAKVRLQARQVVRAAGKQLQELKNDKLRMKKMRAFSEI
jgi:hypothetical protein